MECEFIQVQKWFPPSLEVLPLEVLYHNKWRLHPSTCSAKTHETLPEPSLFLAPHILFISSWICLHNVFRLWLLPLILLLPLWAKPVSALIWIITVPPNWSLFLSACLPQPLVTWEPGSFFKTNCLDFFAQNLPVASYLIGKVSSPYCSPQAPVYSSLLPFQPTVSLLTNQAPDASASFL